MCGCLPQLDELKWKEVGETESRGDDHAIIVISIMESVVAATANIILKATAFLLLYRHALRTTTISLIN